MEESCWSLYPRFQIWVSRLILGYPREAGMSRPLQRDPTPPEPGLKDIWSSPIANDQLIKQADAIQEFLRSSAEPPSPSSMAKFRGNLQKFTNTVKAKDILQDSLTSYIWDSSI